MEENYKPKNKKARSDVQKLLQLAKDAAERQARMIPEDREKTIEQLIEATSLAGD